MNAFFIGLLLLSIFGLVMGLFKPSLVKLASRGKVTLVFGALIIISFILIAVASPSQSTNSQQTINSSSNVVVATSSTQTAPIKASANTPVKSKTEDKPVPTQIKQTDNQNISPTPSETVSQKNAVSKAKSYLGYTAFSHDGLVAQLEYEQFSHADAVYGADNSGANWNEQAAKKAKQYMEQSSFSRGSLIEQLKFEKFTQAQAEYGANAVGL